jgi:TonB family protein
MKLDINRYIRYCLFLFDSCTVNGLGSFQIMQSPPKPDHNGNYIQEEKYTIAFSPVHTEKARLAYLISSKENCPEQEAENAIKSYVKSVFEEIAVKNEVWFRELGMLIKKNGELRFLSHKFTTKELKQQVTDQTSLLYTADNQLNNAPLHHSDKGFTLPAANKNTPVYNLDTATEFEYNNFSPAALPIMPLIQKPEKSKPAEEVAAAVFIAAIPNNNFDNHFAVAQNESVSKYHHLFVNNKKKLVYGASIAGCLLLSYGLYSFLSSNKNAQPMLYTGVAGTVKTEKENNLKNLVTEGTNNTESANNNEITFGKNAAYILPNANKEKNTAVTGIAKDKKKEAETEKETREVISTAPAGNNNYIAAKTTALEKQASPGETTPVLPEQTAVQLKPAIKVDIPVSNEKAAAETKPEIVTDAEFPGGKNKFANFLKQKLIYPESAIEESKEGVSFVKITIDKNGNIKSTDILNSLGAAFDMEIKRVINRMPQWAPAKKNGVAVESSYNFRVSFKNDNKKQEK